MELQPERRPLHQTLFWVIAWTVAGISACAAAFGNFVVARSVITPGLTYLGTALLVVTWLGIEILARIQGIRWRMPQGRVSLITSLGLMPRAMLCGVVLMLWIPRVLGDPIGRIRPTIVTLEELLRHAHRAIDESELLAWLELNRYVFFVMIDLWGQDMMVCQRQTDRVTNTIDWTKMQVHDISDDIVSFRIPDGSIVVDGLPIEFRNVALSVDRVVGAGGTLVRVTDSVGGRDSVDLIGGCLADSIFGPFVAFGIRESPAR